MLFRALDDLTKKKKKKDRLSNGMGRISYFQIDGLVAVLLLCYVMLCVLALDFALDRNLFTIHG